MEVVEIDIESRSEDELASPSLLSTSESNDIARCTFAALDRVVGIIDVDFGQRVKGEETVYGEW